MTETEMRALTDRWLPCWERGPEGADDLLACYSPDAVLVDPNAPEGRKGHGELREFFHQMLSAYPDWQFAVEYLAPTPDGFVFQYRVDLDYLGETFAGFRGVDVMTVVDGLITRHEGYYDRAPLTLHRLKTEGQLVE